MIALPAGMPVKNISVLFGSTGATGPTHWWFGLTDVQLNVLAVTADQVAAAIAANQFSTLPVTVPYLVQYTGLYYVVASVSTSTTQPTYGGGAVYTAAAAMTPVSWGTAGTQATPPAIGAQLASGTVTAAGGANIGAWLS